MGISAARKAMLRSQSSGVAIMVVAIHRNGFASLRPRLHGCVTTLTACSQNQIVMADTERTPVTPTRAMATLRGEEYSETYDIHANTGSQSVLLSRNRYGTIMADVYVDVLDERRTLPVTTKQARDIVVRARRPDSSGTTLARVPKE